VSAPQRETTRPASIAAPAIVMGAGIGGFIDGILAHQIFQWHGMLTQLYPNTTMEHMELNMLADGLFHVVTLSFVLAGSYLLWARARRGAWRWTWRSLTGWMLVGWGLFNLIEGTLNHHLLQLHRVNPAAANPLAWDLGFLVLGALLVVGGRLLARRDSPRDPA
jgi:uncharacterized membrane protein